MKPEPRVFTDGERCTKLEIWNCFRTRRGFKRVQVDKTHAQVGVHAPKNWLRNGYAEVITVKGAEHYQLTDDGIDWLRKGIKGFVKRHPDLAPDALYLPKSA